MTALPSQRGTSGGSTTLPVAHAQLVDIDFLNAGALVIARKTTAKQVSNSTTETDLLNGEFTLPANVLGTRGLMRLTMWGDSHWGASQILPRLRLKMGSGPTTLLDSGSSGGVSSISSNTNRGWWRIVVEIEALGATNAQVASIDGRVFIPGGSANQAYAFATGQGTFFWPGGCANSAGTLVAAGAAYILGGNPSCAIDTTADQAIQFTVVNSSASSTDFQLLGAILEIV